MNRVPSATRANLPSMYAFSLVSAPPPKTPTASAPDSRAMPRKAPATRSSASSQDAGRSGPPRRSRTSAEAGHGAPGGAPARLDGGQPEQRDGGEGGEDQQPRRVAPRELLGVTEAGR